MAGRLRLVAQGLAVSLVAALLGLLVWRVATDDPSDVRRDVSRGKLVEAPDFTLDRLDRPGELTLSSLRGRAVVLNFWASWCIPCRDEAPALERAWRRYRKSGLVVLGVDYQDGKTAARRFARRYKITYPLVRDVKGTIFAKYGGSRLPETFFVRRDGRLVPDLIAGGILDARDRARLERNIRRALSS